MDGIEVMAVIFAKKLGTSVGIFVMFYNVVLYIICGITIGSWILPLYSIVTYAAALKTVDFLVDGIDSSKAAMIITTCPEEIGTAISNEFTCGITVIEAQGFYSSENRTVLYVVLNRFQIVKVKEIVKQLDPAAYVSITAVADLLHGSQENKAAIKAIQDTEKAEDLEVLEATNDIEDMKDMVFGTELEK